MISLTHTPIDEVEFCKVFNLSRCAYSCFVEEGVISLNYSDYLDPTGRVKYHNAWDLIMFSFVLTLGWPIRPKSIVMEEVEEIYDALIIEVDEYSPFFRKSMDGIVEMSLVISSINIFSTGNERSEIGISNKRLEHVRTYLFKIANLIYEIERYCSIDKFTQSTICSHSGRNVTQGENDIKKDIHVSRDIVHRLQTH